MNADILRDVYSRTVFRKTLPRDIAKKIENIPFSPYWQQKLESYGDYAGRFATDVIENAPDCDGLEFHTFVAERLAIRFPGDVLEAGVVGVESGGDTIISDSELGAAFLRDRRAQLEDNSPQIPRKISDDWIKKMTELRHKDSETHDLLLTELTEHYRRALQEITTNQAGLGIPDEFGPNWHKHLISIAVAVPLARHLPGIVINELTATPR